MSNLRIILRERQEYIENLSSQIQEYMLACTLLLPQVQSTQYRYKSTCLLLLYCSHRYIVHSSDTRVHACLYFIAPKGTECTVQIEEYMVACTLLLPQVQSSQFRYNSTCLLVLYCSHRYRVHSSDTRVHGSLYFIAPTGTEYTVQIEEYMVACTLLLPQVQSSQFRYNSTCLLLLYCSHRYRVYSKDTRVHACVYLIDPTGTEYTEKILVYKLVNTLLLLHVRSTQYRYKSKCWFVLHCSHRYIVDSTNIRIHVYTSLQVHSNSTQKFS